MATAFICEECPRTLVLRPLKDFACKQCGQAFHSSQSKAFYCSTGCMAKGVSEALLAKRPPPRECEMCSKPFHPAHPNAKQRRSGHVQRYCSKACLFEWKRERARLIAPVRFVVRMRRPRQRPAPLSTRSCGSCQAPMAYEPWARRCETCSADAKREARRRERQRQKDTGRKAAARKARKLRQRGVTVELVNPLLVLERDRYTCQLCGIRTPKRLRGTYDDRAPEMDHIIPLSQGGEHSYRNVHCACRKCNLAKAGTPMGQMRLFG